MHGMCEPCAKDVTPNTQAHAEVCPEMGGKKGLALINLEGCVA